MTKGELIKELEQYPDDMEVVIIDGETGEQMPTENATVELYDATWSIEHKGKKCIVIN